MAIPPEHTPLIAVVGETASGKSALALAIALAYKGEIICADSRTIYKGMDIGTAKPSRDERLSVPHHLLDLVNPGEVFTAAQFKELALRKIEEISARGNLPVLVGGTGLYVDAVLFDYTFSKKTSSEEREALEKLELGALRQIVQERGFVAPENEKNKRHLIRVIEKDGHTADDRGEIRPHTLVVGLQISRNQLRSRIEKRVELMFRQGLRKEVDELRAKYGGVNEALTGIGYREFEPFYRGDASMSEVKRQIVQDTLHLAKRQRTWFKRNPLIKWHETSAAAQDEVDAFLQRYGYNRS